MYLFCFYLPLPAWFNLWLVYLVNRWCNGLHWYETAYYCDFDAYGKEFFINFQTSFSNLRLLSKMNSLDDDII